jgi:hypothetical protein
MGVGVARGGELVMSDDGVKWRSTFGVAKAWSRPWRDIRRFDTVPFMLTAPGITIYPSDEWDFLGMYFETAGDRDRCLRTLNQRWSAGRRR